MTMSIPITSKVDKEATAEDLRALSPSELETWVTSMGEPKWRASQLLRWMYASKPVDSFESMTNLSTSLRSRLAQHVRMDRLRLQTLMTAQDQTVKALLQLPSGRSIESVLIPSFNDLHQATRMTVCVSSQVGCAVRISAELRHIQPDWRHIRSYVSLDEDH